MNATHKEKGEKKMRKQITKNVEIVKMINGQWRTHIIGGSKKGHAVCEQTATKRAKLIQGDIDDGLIKIK